MLNKQITPKPFGSSIPPHHTPWRAKLYVIIFEADTPAGKAFDVALLWSILLSVITVMFDSVASVNARFGTLLTVLEWIFTILFTIEYILRLICVRRPRSYVLSFFGIVDLLAVIPTYLSIFFAGSQYLLVIRALRLLRVFRVFKLVRLVREARVLIVALRASRPKITVFLFTVLMIVVIIGSLMYLIEGGTNGYDSIPRSVYWAIVTLTTVGYGDIAPHTPMGQALAALVMIMGYSIIAVPTGIVSVELSRASGRPSSPQTCMKCKAEGHDSDAIHCKYCGAKIKNETAIS